MPRTSELRPQRAARTRASSGAGLAAAVAAEEETPGSPQPGLPVGWCVAKLASAGQQDAVEAVRPCGAARGWWRWSAVEDERDMRRKKKKKLTDRPYLLVAHPTFDVSEPNRKRVGPVLSQQNRK